MEKVSANVIEKKVLVLLIIAIPTLIFCLDNFENEFCNKENVNCNVIEPENSIDKKVCDSSQFTKETKFAIQRAKTPECKAKIANLACIADDLYPKELKSQCDFHQKVKYLGCFQDSEKERLFRGKRTGFPNFNNPYECTKFCAQNGYLLAGLQMGFGCVCDNHINLSKKIDEEHCNIPCPDGNGLICGGEVTLNVYEVSLNYKISN